MHVTGATHVCNQDQIEVRVSINLKPNSTPSPAGYPSVSNRDDSGFELGNVLEDRLREVKVVLWRVAPPSIVVR